MNHICFGKSILIRIQYVLELLPISMLITRSMVLIKTTNIYKQNPVLNGYYTIPELEDVLESGYYESPLGYSNVDWFVNQVTKLENKVAFFFKNIKKISL